MIDFWAKSLGNRGGIQSCEHIVSRGLFAEHGGIEIGGFPWCKTPMRVGLDAATKRSRERASRRAKATRRYLTPSPATEVKVMDMAGHPKRLTIGGWC